MANGNEKNLNYNPANQPKGLPYEVHTMPAKFRQNSGVKAKGSWSKTLIVVGIVVLILGLIGLGAYFIYLQMNIGSNPAVINQNLNAAENLNISPENLNAEDLNSNINSDLNQNPFGVNANANENLNLNENANFNANTNINANDNINAPSGIISYSSSLDSDSDKLTDVEEDLYQTEKRNPDTDGDGYPDGEEVMAGFNPKMAGGAKLDTSGLVNKYTNPVYNYEIWYPSSWLARPEDQSSSSILFVTATEEFIRVSVETNPDKLDLVNWYVRMSPGADLNLLQKITTQFGGVKKYEVLASPDKLTYYILDPNVQDKIYVLNYSIGALKQINFLSTFIMMVNSFTVTKPAA